MHRDLLRLLRCCPIAVAVACTSDTPPGAPTRETKELVHARPTEPVPTPPTKPAPSKDPAPIVDSTPAKPTVANGPVLRPIALRRDPLRLLRQRDAPLLVLDGEPLTFVDGAFVHHPVGRKGLPSSSTAGFQDSALAAVNLDEPLGTWVTSGFGGLRYGPKYLVHHREQASWKQLELGKDIILAYYAAYAERDGALLGLRSWSIDPDQEQDYFSGSDEYEEQFPGKLARAETRAKQAWIRLAGAPVKADALPKIPAGMRLDDGAIATADGTLWALAITPAKVVVNTVEPGSEGLADEDAEKPAAGETPKTVLLMWPPGQVEPERVDVPELADAKSVALHDNGDWVIIAGATATESYLALGRGKEWQRVPVSLPANASVPSMHIQGAARLPDGELWIALGAYSYAGGTGQPLWRKPVGGTWQPVAIPEVSSSAFVTDAWERSWRGEWIRPKQDPIALEEASNLIWAAGAIWVVLGPLVSVGDSMEKPRHAVVLTTLPGDAPPAVLTPAWKIELEDQRESARTGKPGQDPCSDFTLVLGPGSLAGPDETIAGFVETIGSLAVERDPGDTSKSIRSVYVGQRDGASVVVAEAHVSSPEQATQLREAAAKIMAEHGGAAKDVVSDCRVLSVERMLQEPKPTPQ